MLKSDRLTRKAVSTVPEAVREQEAMQSPPAAAVAAAAALGWPQQQAQQYPGPRSKQPPMSDTWLCTPSFITIPELRPKLLVMFRDPQVKLV